MDRTQSGQTWLVIVATLVIAGLIAYFTYAALQGDYGRFRRLAVDAEISQLTGEYEKLAEERTRMENLTERLSDNYLDLDLLDERARKVLGMARGDEIVIR